MDLKVYADEVSGVSRRWLESLNERKKYRGSPFLLHGRSAQSFYFGEPPSHVAYFVSFLSKGTVSCHDLVRCFERSGEWSFTHSDSDHYRNTVFLERSRDSSGLVRKAVVTVSKRKEEAYKLIEPKPFLVSVSDRTSVLCVDPLTYAAMERTARKPQHLLSYPPLARLLDSAEHRRCLASLVAGCSVPTLLRIQESGWNHGGREDVFRALRSEGRAAGGLETVFSLGGTDPAGYLGHEAACVSWGGNREAVRSALASLRLLDVSWAEDHFAVGVQRNGVASHHHPLPATRFLDAAMVAESYGVVTSQPLLVVRWLDAARVGFVEDDAASSLAGALRVFLDLAALGDCREAEEQRSLLAAQTEFDRAPGWDRWLSPSLLSLRGRPLLAEAARLSSERPPVACGRPHSTADLFRPTLEQWEGALRPYVEGYLARRDQPALLVYGGQAFAAYFRAFLPPVLDLVPTVDWDVMCVVDEVPPVGSLRAAVGAVLEAGLPPPPLADDASPRSGEEEEVHRSGPWVVTEIVRLEWAMYRFYYGDTHACDFSFRTCESLRLRSCREVPANVLVDGLPVVDPFTLVVMTVTVLWERTKKQLHEWKVRRDWKRLLLLSLVDLDPLRQLLADEKREVWLRQFVEEDLPAEKYRDRVFTRLQSWNSVVVSSVLRVRDAVGSLVKGSKLLGSMQLDAPFESCHLISYRSTRLRRTWLHYFKEVFEFHAALLFKDYRGFRLLSVLGKASATPLTLSHDMFLRWYLGDFLPPRDDRLSLRAAATWQLLRSLPEQPSQDVALAVRSAMARSPCRGELLAVVADELSRQLLL